MTLVCDYGPLVGLYMQTRIYRKDKTDEHKKPAKCRRIHGSSGYRVPAAAHGEKILGTN